MPFAMEPVVYDFAINERGTQRRRCSRGDDALMPAGYYTLTVPALLRAEARAAVRRRAAPSSTASAPPAATRPEFAGMVQHLFDHLLPRAGDGRAAAAAEPGRRCCERYGFDRVQHEQIQADLRAGRIGLAQNRLPVSSHDRGRRAGRRVDARADCRRAIAQLGMEALAARRGGGGDAGRRRRQPLDQGRGRGEGAQPLLPSSAAGTAASSKSHLAKSLRSRPRGAARCCRTSSPPAT